MKDMTSTEYSTLQNFNELFYELSNDLGQNTFFGQKCFAPLIPLVYQYIVYR